MLSLHISDKCVSISLTDSTKRLHLAQFVLDLFVWSWTYTWLFCVLTVLNSILNSWEGYFIHFYGSNSVLCALNRRVEKDKLITQEITVQLHSCFVYLAKWMSKHTSTCVWNIWTVDLPAVNHEWQNQNERLMSPSAKLTLCCLCVFINLLLLSHGHVCTVHSDNCFMAKK